MSIQLVPVLKNVPDGPSGFFGLIPRDVWVEDHPDPTASHVNALDCGLSCRVCNPVDELVSRTFPAGRHRQVFVKFEEHHVRLH